MEDDLIASSVHQLRRSLDLFGPQVGFNNLSGSSGDDSIPDCVLSFVEGVRVGTDDGGVHGDRAFLASISAIPLSEATEGGRRHQGVDLPFDRGDVHEGHSVL